MKLTLRRITTMIFKVSAVLIMLRSLIIDDGLLPLREQPLSFKLTIVLWLGGAAILWEVGKMMDPKTRGISGSGWGQITGRLLCMIGMILFSLLTVSMLATVFLPSDIGTILISILVGLISSGIVFLFARQYRRLGVAA